MATRTYTTLVDDLPPGRWTGTRTIPPSQRTSTRSSTRPSASASRELNLSDLHTETTGSLTINVNTLTRPQNDRDRVS